MISWVSDEQPGDPDGIRSIELVSHNFWNPENSFKLKFQDWSWDVDYTHHEQLWREIVLFYNIVKSEVWEIKKQTYTFPVWQMCFLGSERDRHVQRLRQINKPVGSAFPISTVSTPEILKRKIKEIYFNVMCSRSGTWNISGKNCWNLFRFSNSWVSWNYNMFNDKGIN